jgi:L-asparaginase
LVAAVRAAASVGPVLITHGTDTLSFAAAILAASLNPAWPVILTGATSPLYTEGSDAAVNIGAALAGANELPPGVWVVFATRDQTRAVVLQGGYAVKRSDQPGDFQDIRDEPFGVT